MNDDERKLLEDCISEYGTACVLRSMTYTDKAQQVERTWGRLMDEMTKIQTKEGKG